MDLFDQSTGMAFVRFRNKEAAEKCLDECKNNVCSV